jgi:hypothetical protein
MSVSTKGTAGTSTREIPTQPYIYSHPFANEDPEEQLHADHHHLRIHPGICVVKVQDTRPASELLLWLTEWELQKQAKWVMVSNHQVEIRELQLLYNMRR